ncbi:MAG: hypothetical protein HY700_03595 [Gemmatimonadetes bacterium]|nr:hypothetical protein [Gemmatimonadota bacterium]
MASQSTRSIPPAAWTNADADRSAARSLPDEYLSLRSVPSTRIMQLIDRHWPQYSDDDRRQLAQALLAVLAGLDSTTGVTPELRNLCEGIVASWREWRNQWRPGTSIESPTTG